MIEALLLTSHDTAIRLMHQVFPSGFHLKY